MKIVPLFFQYSGGAFVEFYQEKDENRLHSVVNWIVDIAVVIAFACYLVYGDNRESSEDSRFSSIGNVKRDQLIGKVWFRIQPFSQFGPVSLKGEEG